MATLLKGATLVEFEPTVVEVGDLKVDENRIVQRGPQLATNPGDKVVNVAGKVLMPGLVSGHHHLYLSLTRGMPPPKEPPRSFVENLEKNWWRFEKALDLDAVEVAAAVGGIEALASGTTTLLDHHSSSSAVRGSLGRVMRSLDRVGVRGILSYEVSERHGAAKRDEALEENLSFLKSASGRFRAVVGADACFTLSHQALQTLTQAVGAAGAGFHIHLAEEPSDERISFEKFGQTPVARLAESGLLTPNSILSQVVHLSWSELSQVISTGAWIAHCPRSNMFQQVGYAPAGKFGARAMLGTDGLFPDLFAEAQAAFLRSRDAGQPIDVLRYVANGHRVASQLFDQPLGPLREGALADLLVLDYRPPTALNADNLAWHFLNGFSARHVESVMIDGKWQLQKRMPVSVQAEGVMQLAREVSAAVWARMDDAG